jgi:hypothetical protein
MNTPKYGAGGQELIGMVEHQRIDTEEICDHHCLRDEEDSQATGSHGSDSPEEQETANDGNQVDSESLRLREPPCGYGACEQGAGNERNP